MERLSRCPRSGGERQALRHDGSNVAAENRIRDLAEMTVSRLDEFAVEIGPENLAEKHLQSAFDEVSGAGRESIRLEHWPGVGQVDVMVKPRLGVELKWARPGTDTLANCAWDVAKLATAVNEGTIDEGYIVAGARAEDWASKVEGSELFGNRTWVGADIVDQYERWWRSWCRAVTTRPVDLPSAVTVAPLDPVKATLAGTPWEIRLARVTVDDPAWRPHVCPHVVRGEGCGPQASRSSRAAQIAFKDLVTAWRDERRWRDAHVDLSRYYGVRYLAYSKAFGADLNRCPDPSPPLPAWMDRFFAEEIALHEAIEDRARRGWASAIHRLALRVDKQDRAIEVPTGGYMEAPPEIVATSNRFSPGFREAVELYNRRAQEMIVELMAALFPDAAAKAVTSNDLRVSGFDPNAREPDEYLYW